MARTAGDRDNVQKAVTPVTTKLVKYPPTKIDFHKANVLGYLAKTYQHLDEAIFEAVQNAIDANSKKITVSINKDPKVRSIHIHDDGDGASYDYFKECLSCVGDSMKRSGKLGRYGLGVVASFDKCVRFLFASEPRDGSNGMLEWTFDTAALKAAENDLEAPTQEIRLPEKPWWRSRLRIEKYETDKIRANLDLDMICDGILTRYNEHMKPNKTKVIIKITEADGSELTKQIEALDYTGSPLPVKIYESELSGRTELRLYLAKPKVVGRVPAYKGVIRVKCGNNSGQLLTEKTAAKVFGGLKDPIEKSALAKLTSGIFEGIINFDDQKVQMDPSRLNMVQSVALLDACERIQKWINEIGQPYIAKIEDESKDERYERLGKRSLKLLNHLYKKDSDLGKLMRRFKVGSTGIGHFDVNEGRETGEHLTATSTDGTAGLVDKKPKKSDESNVSERKPPEREKPEHTPTTVVSKNGNPRKLVRDNSLGLAVAFGRIDGTWMWDLDPKKGILTINIFHYLWSGVESAHQNETAREKCLMDLQERLIIGALRMHEAWIDFAENDPGGYIHREDSIKQSIQDVIPLITHADKLTKRGQFYNRLRKQEDEAADGKDE